MGIISSISKKQLAKVKNSPSVSQRIAQAKADKQARDSSRSSSGSSRSSSGSSRSSSGGSSSSSLTPLQIAQNRLNSLVKGSDAYNLQVYNVRKLQGLSSGIKISKPSPTPKNKVSTLKVAGRSLSNTNKIIKIPSSKQPIPKSKNITYRDPQTGKLTTINKGIYTRAEKLSNFEADVQAQKDRRYKELRISKNPNKSEWNPKEIGKSILRSPVELFTGIFTIGGRVGLAVDSVVNRQFKALKQAGKDTPKAVLSMYVTKKENGGYTITPSNVFNIITTAVGVRALAKSSISRNAFNKQMNNAKVKAGTVKLTDLKGGKVKVQTTGKLKLPEVKYAGKTFKSKTVPFKETKIISKTSSPSKFSTKTINKFRVSGANGKAKFKVSKSKGKLKSIELKDKTITKSVSKSRGVKTKSYSSSTKKQTTTISKSRGRIKSLTETKIKNLKNPSKGITQYEIDVYSKSVPKLKLKSQIKTGLKNLKTAMSKTKPKNTVQIKNILKNTKKLLKTAKKNGIKVSSKKINLIERLSKKLPKGKKASLSIKRGSSSNLKGTRNIVKDTISNNVDDILNSMNEKLKGLKTKSKLSTKNKPEIKISSKLKIKPKIKPNIKNVNLNNIINQGKSLLMPKIIVFPLPLLINSSINKVLGGVKTPINNKIINKIGTSEGVISKPEPKGDIGTKTKPITDSIYKSNSEIPTSSNNIINNFFDSVVPASIIGASIIPFSPLGFPILSPSGKGSPISIPSRRLPKRLSYGYTADLYSRLYGIRASKKEKRTLLSKSIYTGLESRKLI